MPQDATAIASPGALEPPPAAAPHERLDAHDSPAGDVLHLNELVGIVRRRLDIDDAFPDDAMLASLQAISARSAPRDRWRAAFDSNLGHWIALKGADLNSALNTLIALLPKPRL